MKILIVNSYYYPNCNGGAELCARSLAEQLLTMGNQVEVLTIDDKTHTDTVNGVKVYYLSSYIRKWRYKKGIKRLIYLVLYLGMDFINFIQYIRLIKGKYDIIHTHAIEDLTTSIWLAAGMCRIPVVYTIHDDYIQCPRLFLLKKNRCVCSIPRSACKIRFSLNKWLLQQLHITQVALSETLANNRNIKAHVIPNGIKITERKHPLEISPFRIAFIGNLIPLKGVELLLDAFQHLSMENTELHIAGDGELREVVEKAGKNNSNIYYYGWVKSEQKEAFFEKANVLVCPSTYENLPYVILEAYGYGIPVIASRVGGIPEMVDHEKTGLLFEVGNREELEASISRMRTDKSLYLKCCYGACEKAKDYSLEKMAGNYFAVYNNKCQNNKRTIKKRLY